MEMSPGKPKVSILDKLFGRGTAKLQEPPMAMTPAHSKQSKRRESLVDKMYRRLEHAETGTVHKKYKDRDDGRYWRRTMAYKTEGGSTAFGPVQMGSVLDDVAKRPDHYNLDKNDLATLNQLMKQRENFNYHGNKEGKKDFNRMFNYTKDSKSGRGILDAGFVHPEKFKQDYEKLAKKVILEHLIRSGGDEQKAVELWRDATPQEDPEYYNRYYSI